jgi:hypothetical protein
MNGYRARVERHRRELAEAASRGERAAVSDLDLIATMAEGIAEAVYHGKRPGKAAKASADRREGKGDPAAR